MRVASVGHAVFAATFIALGILGLSTGDFTGIWEPVPKGVPAREALAYLCALVSLASGVGLLWPRAAAAAARLLLTYLLVWLLLFRVPIILGAPTTETSWEECGETAVIVAGAWILYGWFSAGSDKRHLGFAAGEKGVRLARMLYGLALIPLGLGHLTYVKETASLIPGWLPGHLGWVYFTGWAYIVAGVAVILGICARLAAALSALQMAAFTLLVWGPIVLAAHTERSEWAESIISWTLTIAAWVVTDSYRGTRWLALGKR
jgi:uncharacterized membrane protein